MAKASKKTVTAQKVEEAPKKKIDKLTPEQEAMLPVYRDDWIKIGLSTEPVNFEKAKAAICEAYRAADLKEPTQFHVVDSPMAAIDLIKKLDPSKSSQTIFNEMIFGAHDASWLVFYAFFRDVVGLECCNKLSGLIELAKHCGWLNVYEDVVVFQHRPESIKMDDENRLHCENGPAIRYRDGYSVYAWHGTRIPGEWIEKKGALTPKIALTWSNIEQRRCACEILGWAKILEQLDAKVINEDKDPEIGVLLEVELPELGKEKFLKVQCGTGRTFCLPVPPTMKTAIEANAWTYNLDLKTFTVPEVRT